MRKIKFRAWDTLNNKYFENTYEAYKGDLEVLQIGLNGRLQLITSLERRDESLFPDRFIIQQYTGLKDKNGVDIYEGDIIRGPHDYGPGGFIEVAAPVKYHVIHGYQLHYFLLDQTEVIGNIYEHPELLGDS